MKYRNHTEEVAALMAYVRECRANRAPVIAKTDELEAQLQGPRPTQADDDANDSLQGTLVEYLYGGAYIAVTLIALVYIYLLA